MEKKQVSKSKLWMFVFAGLFVVSVALAVWMVMLMPKERTYEAPSGNIIDVVSLENSEWLYATSDGTLVKMADEDNIEDTYSIIKMVKEKYDIEAGVFRKFYKETGSDYLWFFTSHLDEAGNSNSYMFQAKYKDGDVELNAYTSFDGNLDNIYLAEQNGYLYVVTSGKQVAELFKFDVADVEAGVIQNTYLYDCVKDGKKVKLTAVRMPNGICCFEAYGDYLYILYDAGVIRVATDFGDVTYQSKNSSYKVDSLEPSKYISFGLTGVSASGGALVEETKTLYVTARNSYLYKLTLSDVDTLKIGDDLKCQTVEDIYFDTIPAKDNVVWYKESDGIGYVRHDSSSKITKLNFKTEEVEFDFNLEFNINKIIQGETEDDIFFP